MKAVVKYGKGPGMVELREVPEPDIKDDEVRVEVKAASVCGSDLHIYHDSHPYWPPVILGHEFSGVVAEVGKAVKGWKIGDRIVSETRTGSCGLCYTCQSGYPQVCEQKRAFGIGTHGAFGKWVAVPAKLLHRLPDSIPFEVGAIMEPIAVCITALFERCHLQAGESAVVTGPGPIGLICLNLALDRRRRIGRHHRPEYGRGNSLSKGSGVGGGLHTECRPNRPHTGDPEPDRWVRGGYTDRDLGGRRLSPRPSK